MPILSAYAQRKKIDYFLKKIPINAKILDIGSGTGWIKKYALETGWKHYKDIDLLPPADIIGDINDWNILGLKKNSYDYIIAFELIEHVDCIESCYNLLKTNGKLLITTPLPSVDWFLKILEIINLSQKRGSPHNNLMRLCNINIFRYKKIKIIGFLSQWGLFTK